MRSARRVMLLALAWALLASACAGAPASGPARPEAGAAGAACEAPASGGAPTAGTAPAPAPTRVTLGFRWVVLSKADVSLRARGRGSRGSRPVQSMVASVSQLWPPAGAAASPPRAASTRARFRISA
jgi:hypothetical protein